MIAVWFHFCKKYNRKMKSGVIVIYEKIVCTDY